MSKLKDGDFATYTDPDGKKHTGILQELSAQWFLAAIGTQGVEGVFIKNLVGVTPLPNKGNHND